MTPRPSPSEEPSGGAAQSSRAIVNAETIRQLREMAGDEGYRQIRGEFLSSTVRALGEMRLAAEKDDLDGLLRKLHALKGASGSLGAAGLESLCRELERTVAAATRQARAEAVARLAAEFESVRSALTEIP